MTKIVARKWLVAVGVVSALAASPGWAAKDVVVAVGSNFTTLDPYDANDTLSQAVAKSFYQGLFGLDKEMKLKNVLAPRPFAQCHHARHHTRRYFRLDVHFTTIVKDAHLVAVVNAASLCIHRVDPHFLTAGCFQNIHVAIGRVDARLIVEAGQLQREFLHQRIV